MSKNYVVGVDIGGQTSKIGVVDCNGNILSRIVINSRYDANGAELFMDALSKAISELIAPFGSDSIKGIGIGAPNGNVYSGCIEYAVNIPFAKNCKYPLKENLEKRLGLPVKLTNDANAAAIGEMTYGNARGMKNFIMLTLGTGVGSGIVINGELVYGHDGFAGELGHTKIVRRNGRLCGCGNKGCLEAYCSATGIVRTMQEWLEKGLYPQTQLRKCEQLSAKDIYLAALKGDIAAIEVFQQTGTLLGEACANFVAFCAPQAILVFGGLARAGDLIFKPMHESLEASVAPIWRGKIKILPSALDESDAAILGASALVW